MEETKDQVGFLVLLNVFHPFTGTTDHLLKLDTFPDRLVQPVWNGRGKHTDHTDLHAVFHMYGVGLQTGIDALGISLSVLTFLFHDVGTQQRTTHLTDPLVIHLVTRLYIVVAYGLGIILHVVDHSCGQILVFGHHIIGPIHTGLSLQDITVINEQQVVAALLTLAVDIRVGTGQSPPERPALHEVPREEMSVNITGLNDLQRDGLRSLLCLH